MARIQIPPVKIEKPKKNKPNLILMQTKIPLNLANFLDIEAQKKEMTRCAYLRVVLEQVVNQTQKGLWE